jgi:hypothetical protein
MDAAAINWTLLWRRSSESVFSNLDRENTQRKIRHPGANRGHLNPNRKLYARLTGFLRDKIILQR